LEAAREQARAMTFEKPITIGLSNSLQRPFTTSPLRWRKEVHRVNVKMSHKLTVFLRLLINTCLKKQTIFINAMLLKYHECREIHLIFINNYTKTLSKPQASLIFKATSLFHLD
jgi:hypothetical protein